MLLNRIDGRRVWMATTGFAALLFVMPALAEMSAPDGWYLEGNVGTSNLSGKSYPGPASTSGIGANVDVGYKFMPYFGLEIGYTYYPSTTIKNFSGSKAATDKHYSYDLSGKGILPIMDSGFELFTKIGVARIRSSTSVNAAAPAASIGITSGQHTSTGLYLALGGEYYVIPSTAINVQWATANGNSTTGTDSLLSVGASMIIG